ncbi:HAMP domain-containing protein (plasmid) [Leisingera sp. M527]|uniref:ATP-binding protein n=1 Tax=Leisingera sp. M527 TaxID=2867014 RepID=UPI0021A61948|nr:ATP-binding protein [Leisingera sp. M527]UWQ35709.1 HAMP domain-containing protein [Leisingera sp. M527]
MLGSSLRTKLVVYTVLIVLAVAGAIAAISVTLAHRTSAEAYEQHVTDLAKTLGEAVLEPLYELDIKRLRQQTGAALASEGAMRALILDAGTRVLTDGTDDNLLRGQRFADPLLRTVVDHKQWIVMTDGSRIRVAGPVLATADTRLGYVVLEFSTARLDQEWMAHVSRILLLSGFCALFASLAAIIMANRITRPVKRLTVFADSIRQGSRPQDVPDCGRDEIGRLALAFAEVLTHLDRSNADLTELTASLEAKVKERTREAEAGNKAKSEFLATMSHEIRTPMNGVLGMASLLEETDLDEDQALYAQTISESGEALLEIINEILDFSKIESGKLELRSQPVDIRDLLSGVVRMLEPKAAESRVALRLEYEPDFPSAIMGDEGRIRQIIVNLVGNAVKFTENGAVTVKVTGTKMALQTRFNIAVEDTGIGIPKDKLASVFNAFSQVNSSATRDFGGTGLGLGIASRLAHLMGGGIDVRSEPGKGSTFTFSCTFSTARDFVSGSS